MNKAELIEHIQAYYAETMQRYQEANKQEQTEAITLLKAELLGMLKGYKSSLILINTLNQ